MNDSREHALKPSTAAKAQLLFVSFCLCSTLITSGVWVYVLMSFTHHKGMQMCRLYLSIAQFVALGL